MRTRMALVALIIVGGATAASTAQAGRLYFKEDFGCGGDTVDHVADDAMRQASYGGIFDGKNDEITSVYLERVIDGTRIALHDARQLGEGDDFVEIQVRKYTASKCIDLSPVHFADPGGATCEDPSGRGRCVVLYEDPSVTMRAFFRSDGRVAGKVSSWRSMPGMSMGGMRPAVDQMHALFEQQYGHFPNVGGTAFEFTDSDHWFRMHRPTVSPMFFVSFKLDHIRGGAEDDYAIVSARTDADGKPIDKADVNVVMAGNNIGQIFVDITNEIIMALPEDKRNSKEAIIAKTAVTLANKVYVFILEHTNWGGREVFANQVRHKTNEVLDIMDRATP